MVSGVEFRSAITRWAATRLPQASKLMLQEAASALGSKIVRKTPVRTGLARGNHRLAIGNRVGRRPISRRDKTGRATIADIVAAAARLAAYSSFTIYNALPYIERLENGWSRQAPNGMFRLSLQEFRRELPQVARKVRKQLGSWSLKV